MLLALYTNTSGCDKRFDNIRNDELQKMRRNINGWFGFVNCRAGGEEPARARTGTLGGLSHDGNRSKVTMTTVPPPTTVGTTNTLYTGILHAPDFSMRAVVRP